MKFNINASPIDLYDMVGPSYPMWVTQRNAIENYKDGDRPPVFLSHDWCNRHRG